MSDNKKILIGSPIFQKPEILEQYLKSLERLDKQQIDVEYMFVDDNADVLSKELLTKFQTENSNVRIISGKNQNEYKCDENTHYWSNELMNKVGSFKNEIIEYALDNNFDYLFFVDSDLVLNKKLLKHLISCDKDILSEIFWTKWTPQSIHEPNVWLYDQYSFVIVDPKQPRTPTELFIEKVEFLQKLKQPGQYKVGGLGACTLISRNALAKGVNFSPLDNLTLLRGEDRFFCVRAEVLSLDLYVDTHYPAYHIYRESDLEGVADYIKANH